MTPNTPFATLFDYPTLLPGPLYIVEQNHAITHICFPNDPKPPAQLSTTPLLKETQHQLLLYLQGHQTHFSIPLQPQGTPFQRTVWNALTLVPYGHTTSYKNIALAITHPNAQRAVGSAIAHNPIPILIPCHRILPASGLLGNFRPGPTWKSLLLSIENIPIH